jgi:signal transduction histidine kinase
MARIRALLPASLRWRLTVLVAIVMMVSVAVIFFVVYDELGTHLRRQIDRDIAGDTTQLSQALQPLHPTDGHQVAVAANRYVSAQPYGATSTLLFVIIPGEATASNHPEVFGGRRPSEGETAAEQVRENAEGRRLLVPRLGYSVQHVPDVGPVRIHERVVSIGGIHVVVGAGEPLATVEQSQHGLAGGFLLAGALTIALALLASYIAGVQVSKPLRRLTAVAARVNAGDLAPRMEIGPDDAGGEVAVLAEAFNNMLDRLAEAFASQREFIADASHELRTPLTVIRGQLEVLAAQPEPTAAEVQRVEGLVQSEITRMARLVNDLLVLAQAEKTDFLRVENIGLRPFVADLWDGVSLTAERRFELGPVPEGTLRADPDRLAQALRNLAGNAIEHTSPRVGLVRLEVARAGYGDIRFTVIDDGPGIPEAERERVFERLHRTDAARARSDGGAGLGLAIVRAIAEAHGGDVSALDPRNGSGARVELVLPGFIVAPVAVPVPRQ